MATANRVARTGPKKLLALDGGGIRGAVTVEVLARIEATLRKQTGTPRLLLGDYFDYIAGTSSGAIIAAGLAMGMDTAALRRFYEDHGPAIFTPARLWQRFTRHKYHSKALSEKLQEIFGPNTLLGSNALRTLLMLVMRNATTDAPWMVSNNPNAKFNDRSLADCHLNLPLWQLLRASAAAPTYFDPQPIVLAGKAFQCVDGGTTTYNNPAFLLFLMATLEPYRLCWPVGEQRMLLVSVGTGHASGAPQHLPRTGLNLFANARLVPAALMSAALHEQDTLCRVFGRCLVGDEIDLEVGDLRHVPSPAYAKLFTYLRYDVKLTPQGLQRVGLPDMTPTRVSRLDAINEIHNLQRLGRAIAARVEPAHFERFLPEPNPRETTRSRDIWDRP